MKGHYIRKEDQNKIQEMIESFQEATQFGKIQSRQSDRIFEKLMNDYLERLIMGVIYSPMWRYYTYGEVDDMQNEARMHLYRAFTQNKFDKTRGTSLFAFLTAVISNNLRTYTKSQNRNLKHTSGADLEQIAQFLEGMKHYDLEYDDESASEYVNKIGKKLFIDDDKALKLNRLLSEFIRINQFSGKKFYKKNFVEYAKTLTGYSSSLILSFLKKLKKATVK